MSGRRGRSGRRTKKTPNSVIVYKTGKLYDKRFNEHNVSTDDVEVGEGKGAIMYFTTIGNARERIYNYVPNIKSTYNDKNIYNCTVMPKNEDDGYEFIFHRGSGILRKGENYIAESDTDHRYDHNSIKELKVKYINGEDVEWYVAYEKVKGYLGKRIESVYYVKNTEFSDEHHQLYETGYKEREPDWLKGVQNIYNLPRNLFLRRFDYAREEKETRSMAILEAYKQEVIAGKVYYVFDAKNSNYKANSNMNEVGNGVVGSSDGTVLIKNINGILDLSLFNGLKVIIKDSKIKKIINTKTLQYVEFNNCDFTGMRKMFNVVHAYMDASLIDCKGLDHAEINSTYTHIKNKTDKEIKIREVKSYRLEIVGNIKIDSVSATQIYGQGILKIGYMKFIRTVSSWRSRSYEDVGAYIGKVEEGEPEPTFELEIDKIESVYKRKKYNYTGSNVRICVTKLKVKEQILPEFRIDIYKDRYNRESYNCLDLIKEVDINFNVTRIKEKDEKNNSSWKSDEQLMCCHLIKDTYKEFEKIYTQEEVEKKVKEIFTIRFNGVKQDLDKILETEDNGRTNRIYYRCKGVKRD